MSVLFFVSIPRDPRLRNPYSANRVLPPGTNTYVPPYVLHCDARNFVFPDAFWPERWLVASGHLALELARAPPSISSLDSAPGACVDFVHNKGAFIPFSYKPMNCVGKGFAMLQMRTVVCAIMQRFRVRLQEGREPRRYEAQFRDYMFANRPELPVVLEPLW